MQYVLRISYVYVFKYEFKYGVRIAYVLKYGFEYGAQMLRI